MTTLDVTPPSTPGNVAALATSCEMVKVTWSPSSDNEGVSNYAVFWGISPDSLTQIARTPASITAYTHYPLACGTTYYYGIEAVDKSGNDSAMSGIVSVTTPMPPSPPSSLSANPTSATAVTLSWSGALGGGLPVQHYHVMRGLSASALSQVATVTQASFVDRTAAPATTYYYGVEAADSGGDLSPLSPIVSASTPALPVPPTSVTASPDSATKIAISWAASAGGGLSIGNYRVYRGLSPTSLSQLAIVLKTSFTDSTATPGTVYYYGVVAADILGDLSPMSGLASTTSPTAPQAPDNLVAKVVSISSLKLTWSASIGGGLPIRNYTLFRGTSPGNLAQIALLTKTSYIDSALAPGTAYFYALQAADTGGDLSPLSSIVQISTPALPSAPGNLVASAPAPQQANLTWTASSGGYPLKSYGVYRGATPDSLTLVKVLDATKTAYVDHPLIAGTTYCYGVQATDNQGNLSQMSGIVEVTTPQ